MKTLNHWHLLFQEHKQPCLLAKIDTDEVVYYNEEMELLLGEDATPVGQKFYEVIPNDSSALGNNPHLNWEYKDTFDTKIFNKSFNQVFSVAYTLVESQGERYIWAKYRPIQTTKHIQYTFEEMMSRCISVAQQEEKIPALLEILGEFYDADRSFVYQVDLQKPQMTCSFFWSKEADFVPIADIAKKMDPLRILDWFQTRNEVGMIEASKCHGSYCHVSTEAEILSVLKLENIVVSVIEDLNHIPIALVAVSNRRNMSADFRLLQAVTRFVESDISKSSMIALSQIDALDLLTSFYNRNSYSKKTEAFKQNPPKSMGVSFANVNGLKKINTNYGLAKGDSYIKKCAELLKEHFKVDLYRISGDEFLGFFPEVEKEDFETQIQSLQEKMKAENNAPFALGHAWGDGHYDLLNLIKDADNVMYINKQEYYHTSFQHFHEMDNSILGELLSFIKNEEFFIYLQPQVHLKDGSLYGAEALIRRFDKTNQKMVFPDQFIPLYEQNSVIRHVDIFVIEEVCKLLQSWSGYEKQIPISVNLSRVTLQEYGIVGTISKICDKYQVSRKLLVIEVTERVGLVENNVASSLITEFKDHGFLISLDDFGCAYSNIVTLAQIQVDEVKIDKSLVDFLVTNKKNQILVKNVLAMCNELENTSTLAEGIENQEQANLLYELNCHLGQGFYFSRPIPVEAFTKKYISPPES